MKVLDVTEFYSERGGGVRSYLTLKNHVSCQLGHEHVILAPGPRRAAGPNRDPSSKVIRIPGPSMPYDATYHLLWRVDKIREEIRRQQPDVLEIHSPYVAALGALAAPRGSFGLRTFVWHSDFIDTYARVLRLQERMGARAADAVVRPLWAWVRRIGWGCDATIVASRWQQEKLASHGVPRLHRLPFGVDKQVFRPEAAGEACRQELLGPDGGDLLLAVGRLAVEKEWDVVLDAFVTLRETRRATLVVFGDGPERARLEAKVRGRADVRFMGFVTDRAALASAMASADALVHACPHETFGIGMAEAIACGLPLVVPDRGGAVEQARPEYAETFASGDAAACAAAVARLLDRDRPSLRAATRAAGGAVLGQQEHFERLFALYEELGAARRARGGATLPERPVA